MLSSQKHDNFLTFSELQDQCLLGLRLLIVSRHQSSQPQGWKGAVLSSQKQDNLPTFSELQDWCHLGLRLLIGSRHLSSRPQGWKIAGPQSRIISPPFQNCRTGVILAFVFILVEQDNLPTFSELQDRCHLSLRLLIRLRYLFFPTSRMEECRVILAEQDNLHTFSELQDRCYLSLRPKNGAVTCLRPSSDFRGTTSATPGENNQAERCSLKENAKKSKESQTLSLLKQALPHKYFMSPQDTMKQTDWICQLDDFGRRGSESATTQYSKLKNEILFDLIGCEEANTKKLAIGSRASVPAVPAGPPVLIIFRATCTRYKFLIHHPLFFIHLTTAPIELNKPLPSPQIHHHSPHGSSIEHPTLTIIPRSNHQPNLKQSTNSNSTQPEQPQNISHQQPDNSKSKPNQQIGKESEKKVQQDERWVEGPRVAASNGQNAHRSGGRRRRAETVAFGLSFAALGALFSGNRKRRKRDKGRTVRLVVVARRNLHRSNGGGGGGVEK
ncbi:hypothetical protein GQ457_11G026290 [Hibiscus cannabinus]